MPDQDLAPRGCDAAWRYETVSGSAITCDRTDRHRKHRSAEPGLLIEWTDDAEGAEREDDQ